MPEITLDGFEEVSVGGFRLDVGGPYTLTIAEKPELHDLDTDKPYMTLKMKVIDGPDQEEDNSSGTKKCAGQLIGERLYLNAKFMVKRYLIAIGLLARDDTESPMAKGKFNTDLMFNQKFTALVKASMYQGKERRNVEPIIDK